MGSFATATLSSMLDALARNVAYSNLTVFAQLHLADPGAAGTTSPAANTTRQQVTCATAAAAGSIANTAAVTWTAVPSAETYVWISLWTAVTAGTFLGRDDLSAVAAVGVGDTFTIPIGSLTLSLT